MRESDNGDGMHRHVDWMVPADVVIMEFLDAARTPRGQPSIQTPNTIALNTGYSNRHCSARAQELSERGLVERLGKGQYRLSDLGRRAVGDDISLEDLRELTGGSR